MGDIDNLYETTLGIELAIVQNFGKRVNVILPNAYWGLGFNHEIDLLVIKKSGFAYEIEIKISLQDLKKDLFKHHNHYSTKLKRLYFAMPMKLQKHINLVPGSAGILLITRQGRCIEVRKARNRIESRKFNEKEIVKACKLGLMRYWNFKEKLARKTEERGKSEKENQKENE